MIRLKRAYDKEEKSDGARFLVDRLWPRAMKKTDLHVEAWLKDAAPSRDLLRWFGHDPDKWHEFRRRYLAGLGSSKAWEPLLQAAREGTVTLVFSARNTEQNNAMVLKEFLEEKLKRS